MKPPETIESAELRGASDPQTPIPSAAKENATATAQPAGYSEVLIAGKSSSPLLIACNATFWLLAGLIATIPLVEISVPYAFANWVRASPLQFWFPALAVTALLLKTIVVRHRLDSRPSSSFPLNFRTIVYSFCLLCALSLLFCTFSRPLGSGFDLDVRGFAILVESSGFLILPFWSAIAMRSNPNAAAIGIVTTLVVFFLFSFTGGFGR